MKDNDKEEPVICEQGLITLSEQVWQLAFRRNQVVAPLAEQGMISHLEADIAAAELSISRDMSMPWCVDTARERD